MASSSFQFLEKKAKDLKKTFFPKSDTTKPLKRDQYERLTAYTVLIHAEIEEYIESIAQEICDNSLTKCNSTGEISFPLSRIILFVGKTGKLTDTPKNGGNPIDATVKNAIREFKTNYINTNHGIRISHLYNLLLPIGFDLDDFAPTLIANLDNLANKRGSVAHLSYKSHTSRTSLDPKSLEELVNNIIFDLIKIDDKYLLIISNI